MRATRAAACLAWEAPSVTVRWCAVLSVVIVTHLVTRSLASRCRQRLLIRLQAIAKVEGPAQALPAISLVPILTGFHSGTPLVQIG